MDQLDEPMLAPRCPLSDEATQFRLLLDSITDYAIYMLDPNGYVKTWNPGGQRIKGYSPQEIVGTHFSRFCTPEGVAAGLPQRGLDAARNDGRFSAEGWRLRKDGTRFFASVVIDPIWVGDELVGYAKVTRDITELVQAQQRLREAEAALLQAQKMEAIGKLTMGLAHDFNNLLGVVINALELITMRVSHDPRLTRNVDAALRAAERGALLTRQLLVTPVEMPGSGIQPSGIDSSTFHHGVKLSSTYCWHSGSTSQHKRSARSSKAR